MHTLQDTACSSLWFMVRQSGNRLIPWPISTHPPVRCLESDLLPDQYPPTCKMSGGRPAPWPIPIHLDTDLLLHPNTLPTCKMGLKRMKQSSHQPYTFHTCIKSEHRYYGILHILGIYNPTLTRTYFSNTNFYIENITM